MPLVKTFEEACQVEGIEPDSVLPYKIPGSADQESINAYAKLIVIIRVLNDGWLPDWNSFDQYKYYPWFETDDSGFGLSYYDCDLWYTSTNAGSRLCFSNRDLAKYAGKQFIDIYTKFMLIPAK